MIVTYTNRKIEREATDLKKLFATYNVFGKKIKQRLDDFKAAENLAVIGKIPGIRCHELSVDSKNIALAVNISGNRRMIFEPIKPYPRKDDGGLDWERVTEICIQVLCEDYH